MTHNHAEKELIKKLKTGREDVILQALKEIRESGNSTILPAIMALLKDEELTEAIANAIFNILNDLNEQSSVDVFMRDLSGYEKEDCFHKLIASCWQNGLDYSAHMAYFINVALKKDYNSAFEALTVIDENITSLDDKERTDLVSKIDLVKDNIPEDKKALINELKKIIKPSPE
ncbi:MAG: hypothetical protein ACOCWA_07025 [Bacteroidota bacterium]